MRNILLIWLLILFILPLNAQKLEIADFLRNSDRKTIADTAATWEYYFNNSCDLELLNQTDYDILKQEPMGRTFYQFGKHYTFEIQPVSDDLYEIITLVKSEFNDQGLMIPYIYKVCAEVRDEIILRNYLDFSKTKVKTFQTKDIIYYYPHDFVFDEQAANETDRFYVWLNEEYKFDNPGKLNFIVANTLDDANHILGYTHSINRSHSSKAAYYKRPNTIVTCKVRERHELVHAIFCFRFPGLDDFLQEGLAVFYGGYGGMDYEDNVRKLRKLISTGVPTRELFDYDLSFEGIRPQFTIGALYVENFIKTHGKDGFLRMLADKSGLNFPELISSFGIDMDCCLRFVTDLIDSHYGN